MIKTLDIAWLAGILEGEASFGYHGTTPVIQLQMTDPDVVKRVAALLGVDVRAPWKPKGKDHYKLVYGCVAHGRKAIGWMMTLYSFMGVRRKEAIEAALNKWKAQPRTTHASRGDRTMARCHPERGVTGWGLCKACYMREYRAKRASLFALG